MEIQLLHSSPVCLFDHISKFNSISFLQAPPRGACRQQQQQSKTIKKM